MTDETLRGDPIERHRASIGWLCVILAFSIPLYRPWMTLAATLIFAVWLLGGRVREHSRALDGDRLTLAVLAFLALNLASLVWSRDPAEGFSYVAKYRYLLLIPMVASAVRAPFRERALAAFLGGSVASVALSAAVVGGVQIGDAHPGNPSPAMAHLDFTLVLALASLLALSRALFGEVSARGRWLWIGASAISACGLLFNIGRSGQLGFVAGLGVVSFIWLRDRSLRVRAATLVVAIIVLAGVWAASPPFLERMKSARTELGSAVVQGDYENSVGSRIAALAVARRMIGEAPILGAGAGGNMPRFRELLDEEFPDLKPAVYWYRHFHNQYAQIATELGLTGLLALGWIFFELLRGPHASRQSRASAWALGAAYLVAFLGEPYLHKQIPLVAFALTAGLLRANPLISQGFVTRAAKRK